MTKQQYVVVVWTTRQLVIYKIIGSFSYDEAANYTDRINTGMTWEIIEIEAP